MVQLGKQQSEQGGPGREAGPLLILKAFGYWCQTVEEEVLNSALP